MPFSAPITLQCNWSYFLLLLFFLSRQTAAATAAAAGFVFSNSFPAFADGPYSLPDLPYPYEALEPYIDAATMKVWS